MASVKIKIPPVVEEIKARRTRPWRGGSGPSRGEERKKRGFLCAKKDPGYAPVTGADVSRKRRFLEVTSRRAGPIGVADVN